MAKYDFAGALLVVGGGIANSRGHVIFRQFYVTLADGTRFKNDITLVAARRRHGRSTERVWQRLTVMSQDTYQQPHYRKASATLAAQIEAWVVAHPDYIPDPTLPRLEKA